jgi:hypothetical protein
MIKIIPQLDWNLGFPQRQRIGINTGGILKAYDFLFRWNESGSEPLLICEITRVEDGATMWRGTIQKLNPFEVEDPVRYDVQFTLMARELDRDNQLLEIWAFEE